MVQLSSNACLPLVGLRRYPGLGTGLARGYCWHVVATSALAVPQTFSLFSVLCFLLPTARLHELGLNFHEASFLSQVQERARSFSLG